MGVGHGLVWGIVGRLGEDCLVGGDSLSWMFILPHVSAGSAFEASLIFTAANAARQWCLRVIVGRAQRSRWAP